MSLKIVIFGGAGFIGSALSSLLLEAGHQVIAVSRSAGMRSSGHPRLEFRSASVANPAQVRDVVAGADIVFDLSMPFGGLEWESWKTEVVDSAVHVAEACLAHSVRRLIYTSSISAVYLGGSATVTEKDGYDSQPESRGFYGRAKLEAEKALLELHRSRSLPVVIHRPGVVLGPGGRLVHGAFGDPVNDTCVLAYGSGRHPLPCVLATDVAQALFLSVSTPGIDGMTFNLAGDVRPTVEEYMQRIAAATRRPFRLIPRPIWQIQARELLFYAVKYVVRRGRVSFPPLRDFASLAMSAPLDCSLAKKVLGWQPCADPAEFYRQALDPHVTPPPAGDIRLEV